MKLYNFLFKFIHNGVEQSIPIQAESVREAKELADSLKTGLSYANSYEEVTVETDEFEGQKIAWVCSAPVEELPFPFKQLKKAALLFAYGTNCQCCLGYRIMVALVLGGAIGYLVG